jgi:Fur family transcriptional regulator, ferric uptake regulator
MSNDFKHDQEAHLQEALSRFRSFLKRNGLSCTKARERVLTQIYRIEGHFTVDELEEALGGSDGSQRATVYRTIKHLMEAGLLAKVQTSTHAKVAYEHTVGHAHHDHLVCDRCGDIIEFHDEKIEASQQDVANRFGFELLHHSMVLTGVCATCRKDRKKRSPSNVIVTIDTIEEN